jgi:thiamine-phosphate pyrophosphorylase
MVIPSGLVVLTDRRIAARPLPEVVAAAVSGGASWVILRERDLLYADRLALAEVLREIVPPGRLIVAGPDPLGGAAVHLAARDSVPRCVWVSRAVLHTEVSRAALHTEVSRAALLTDTHQPMLVGRSCHGVPRLLVEHYVTLSPIYPTETKPGYGPALGPKQAAQLAGDTPWLALGGVDSPKRAAECIAAGASGIAVLGAVMRAADPERVVRQLTSEMAAA